MNKTHTIQIALFFITIITTTIAGAEWMYGKLLFPLNEGLNFTEILNGLQYSIPFILALTFHEFGHYFTARYYNIKVTLPYYIPMWFGILPSIGTMGAFIQMKENFMSEKKFFDVGIAGPLAGFIVGLLILIYGFSNLPEHSYIFKIHPEYELYGMEYAKYVYNSKDSYSFQIGGNLLFNLLGSIFVEDISKIPHPNEIIHYPFLFSGYLVLFFTALNLLPIGQLDGGHIIFGMFGEENSKVISKISFIIFLIYAGLGFTDFSTFDFYTTIDVLYFIAFNLVYLYFIYLCCSKLYESVKKRWLFAIIIFLLQNLIFKVTGIEGYNGWLFFILIIGKYLGVYHPPVEIHEPINSNRKILGWVAIIIFILTFSPTPFVLN